MHASCRHVRKRKGVLYRVEIGNKERQIIRASPAACRVVPVFFLAGQTSISSLVLRTQRAADRSRQLCLLACVVALWLARTCLAALCMAALCCAVIDARWQLLALGAVCAFWRFEQKHVQKCTCTNLVNTRAYKKRPTTTIGSIREKNELKKTGKKIGKKAKKWFERKSRQNRKRVENEKHARKNRGKQTVHEEEIVGKQKKKEKKTTAKKEKK